MTAANSSPPITNSDARSQARGRRLRLVFLVPALAFIGLIVAFGTRLHRDPSTVPSALIGRPAPEFSLAPVKGRQLGLSTADLKDQISMVNVFAS